MAKNVKPRYTAKEKKAFYMGVGAAIGVGRIGEIKRITATMTTIEKKSFYSGFDSQMTKPAPKAPVIPRKKAQSSYNDFNYDKNGRIKGAWIDGRFEPD